MKEENKNRNWLRHHLDLIVMLSAFATSMLWLNGKFNEIEKDIAVIKAVMVMKNIMPGELAKCPSGKTAEKIN